ncbi:uncharacterized protein LOC110819486 isoform X2 [Carica papaya]|uniref:uncharacterized protein LOC110819486 isoform X2 n=1 Tax=Carica papaya TaxID=3649 RepID=UPI000B8C83AF|nr:uncharacterized protein LOC110819486 isoform X2 [Carica papaya]
MGGKGRRRREKNYQAAHGGPTRLPPPPDASKVDALPSKLRRIMSFTSPSPLGSGKISKGTEAMNGKRGSDAVKKILRENQISSETMVSKDGGNDEQVMSPKHENIGEIVQNNGDEKGNKKRKRKPVKDLRFEKDLELSDHSKRRERKKKYWELKKKKQKKGKTEEDVDFPGHEKIKFGEVVEAPPKLVVVPKAPKNVHDASKERIRLQAIEAYRDRKGWTSRPGLNFPPPARTWRPPSI